jgi:hypothetical protein
MKTFRDKWVSDYEFAIIYNAKPHAEWPNGRGETRFWVELSISQQRALKYVERNLFL